MTISSFIKQACVAALLVSVAGCTTSNDVLKLSDGSRGYHIYCGGMPYKSDEDCKSRAEMLCGDGGYSVLKEADPAFPHTEVFWSSTTHDIVVRCNNSSKNWGS